MALFDCDLRKYATEYGVEVKQFLGEARQHERDTSHPLIELDPNKCILCGRCVRICSDVVGVSAYGFINRGFSTVVAPGARRTRCSTPTACRAACASAPARPARSRSACRSRSPGPWKTETADSVCHYCGVGCRHRLRHLRRHAREGVAQRGERGHLRQPLPEGPLRLQLRARARPPDHRAGPARGRAWPDAPVDGGDRPRGGAPQGAVPAGTRAGEMAVFVSPRLTNEEIYLAQKFARVGAQDPQRHVVQPPGEPATCSRPTSSRRRPTRDLASAQAILVVNSNLDDEHFVADLIAKRAIRNGAQADLHRSGRQPHRRVRRRSSSSAGPRPRRWSSRPSSPSALRPAGRTRRAARPRRPASRGSPPAQVGRADRRGRRGDREAAQALAGASPQGAGLQPRLPRRAPRGTTRAARGRGRGARLRRCCRCTRSRTRRGCSTWARNPAWFPGYRPVTDAGGDRGPREGVERRRCATSTPRDVDIAAPARRQGDQGRRSSSARTRSASDGAAGGTPRGPARRSSSSSWPTCSPRRRPRPRTSSCR